MNGQVERPEGMSRRILLSRGARAAYVAPVVIAALKADSAFASKVSGGSPPKHKKVTERHT